MRPGCPGRRLGASALARAGRHPVRSPQPARRRASIGPVWRRASAARSARPLRWPWWQSTLQLAEVFCRLLEVLGELAHLMDAADLDHVIVRGRAAAGPFDGLVARAHIDNP